jgi:hypothetical protein
VAYVGAHWQGSWVIRLAAFELGSDLTNCRDEHTARLMVKADARKHGYGSRVSWLDGYAEPAFGKPDPRPLARTGERCEH